MLQNKLWHFILYPIMNYKFLFFAALIVTTGFSFSMNDLNRKTTAIINDENGHKCVTFKEKNYGEHGSYKIISHEYKNNNNGQNL